MIKMSFLTRNTGMFNNLMVVKKGKVTTNNNILYLHSINQICKGITSYETNKDRKPFYYVTN